MPRCGREALGLLTCTHMQASPTFPSAPATKHALVTEALTTEIRAGPPAPRRPAAVGAAAEPSLRREPPDGLPFRCRQALQAGGGHDQDLCSEALWEAADAAMTTFGDLGVATEYDIERKWKETRLFRTAPTSNNLVRRKGVGGIQRRHPSIIPRLRSVASRLPVASKAPPSESSAPLSHAPASPGSWTP